MKVNMTSEVQLCGASVSATSSKNTTALIASGTTSVRRNARTDSLRQVSSGPMPASSTRMSASGTV